MLQPHGVTAPSISPCSSGPRLSAYRQHTGIPTGIRTAATPQTFHTLPCQDSNTSEPPPQNRLLDRPASAMRRLRYTRTAFGIQGARPLLLLQRSCQRALPSMSRRAKHVTTTGKQLTRLRTTSTGGLTATPHILALRVE